MVTLIAGLGNFPQKYEQTRHNLGFLVIDKLAEKFSFSFSKKDSLLGMMASGHINDNKIILLKPLTYMNESGRSIYNTLAYYNLKPAELIVIQDDLDLDFGVIRTRLKGSNGGHNGLKSIETCLGTMDYRRVRMGIGNEMFQKLKSFKKENTVVDFVLSQFEKNEKKYLDDFCILGMECTLDFMLNNTQGTYKLESFFKNKINLPKDGVKDEKKNVN